MPHDGHLTSSQCDALLDVYQRATAVLNLWNDCGSSAASQADAVEALEAHVLSSDEMKDLLAYRDICAHKGIPNDRVNAILRHVLGGTFSNVLDIYIAGLAA